MATKTCFGCGDRLDAAGGDERAVLVRGKTRHPHCSVDCLRDTVRQLQAARARWWRRSLLGALAVLVVVGVPYGVWQRFRAELPRSIALAWPEVGPPAEPRAKMIFYGPAWPPTDDDWTFAFARASWVYPLPGPVRRAPAVDGRVFGPEPPPGRPASCRTPQHCGVDLGGELWGEHVYAVADGVVDRVRADGTDERGGQYVRLSHFGGMVFTQYFHLAATPRRMRRGTEIKAGEVVGLVGDTGASGGRRHLHFALSVRPSSDMSEVYWDPTPMMGDWRLQVPPHGTVAGLGK